MTLSGTDMGLARATVRYRRSDDPQRGGWWAECGTWSGVAPTLLELRGLAREGLEFTFGGKWKSKFYFETTDVPQGMTIDPVASEEFAREVDA